MNIGIMGDALSPQISSRQVTGYSIAVDDLMRSFFSFSLSNTFTCLAQPGQYHWERAHSLRSGLPEARQKDIRFADENTLLFSGLEPLKDIDVLHSFRGDVLSALALRESLGKAIPMTFTLHGISEQHLLLDTFLPLLLFPFRPYDAILCTSEAVRCTLQRILYRLQHESALSAFAKTPPAIRLEKVPLGVDVNYFRPLDKEKARQRLGIPQDSTVLLWLGRFSSAHKADLFPLFRVFRRLIRHFPDRKLLLLLAGCSSSDPNLQEFLTQIELCGISSQVRVILNQDIPDRAELYNACDIFTSPVDNIQETFGLTPVEAMACGIPQVVSDWDGYRDTVLDGQTGYLIPTAWTSCMDDIKERDFLPLNGIQRSELYASLSSRSVAVDIDAWEEKLCTLISEPELRQKMSKASRNRAVEYFSLQFNVAQTEEIWQNLMQIAKSDSSFQKMNILDLCNDFSYYPTQMLSDTCAFTITQDGIEQGHLPVRERKISTQEDALPSLLLDVFHQGMLFSFSDLIRRFPHYSSSQVKRSVMYLLKCGYIRKY